MKTDPTTGVRPPLESEAVCENKSAGLTPPGIHVVVVYSNLAAGRRAMSMLDRTFHHVADAGSLQPVLWRTDLLDDPDWAAEARTDFVSADLLVLSFDGPADFSPAVEDGVLVFLMSRLGVAAAVLALLGAEDEWNIAIQQTEDFASGVDPLVRLAALRSQLRLPEAAMV